MCGRYQISRVIENIEVRYHVDVDPDLYRRVFNAAPTMSLPVITNDEPGKLSFLRWGLVPFWAKDASIGSRMINARAETLKEKVSFRKLLKSRRCRVIADGFYEWKKTDAGKQPYRICLEDESLLSFAGLWDRWTDPQGRVMDSFTIITTAANPLVSGIHERMPVILHPGFESHWLDQRFPADEAYEFLTPYPAEMMKAYPVSKAVNAVINDGPELLLPLS